MDFGSASKSTVTWGVWATGAAQRAVWRRERQARILRKAGVGQGMRIG
jgi:hypothetical protein